MNYQQLTHTYLKSHPSRQQAYFKLLNDNLGVEPDKTAQRFLKAEYVQAKCSNFKVNP
jgi:hypothetical protein